MVEVDLDELKRVILRFFDDNRLEINDEPSNQAENLAIILMIEFEIMKVSNNNA